MLMKAVRCSDVTKRFEAAAVEEKEDEEEKDEEEAEERGGPGEVLRSVLQRDQTSFQPVSAGDSALVRMLNSVAFVIIQTSVSGGRR